MTIVPTKLTAEVVGKAIYLEMLPLLLEDGSYHYDANKDSIKQIIITPNAATPTGIAVSPTIWSRIVSPHSPRAQWYSYIIGAYPTRETILAEARGDTSEGLYEYSRISKEDFDLLSTTNQGEAIRAGILKELIAISSRTTLKLTSSGVRTRLTELGWKTNFTTTVEVTDEDMALVNTLTTPQAIIRRINKVRASVTLAV